MADMSNSNTDDLLDLPEIEERRAKARQNLVTASTPLVVNNPTKYRVSVFGMAYFEAFEPPKVSPLAKWILRRLGIVFTQE